METRTIRHTEVNQRDPGTGALALAFAKATGIASKLPRSVGVFSAAVLLAGMFAAGLGGCARVQQKDREFLSDPIMQRVPDPLGAGLESHNLPRREGSSGASSGSGGGCGC